MFICEECLDKEFSAWQPPCSVGTCEICGKKKACADWVAYKKEKKEMSGGKHKEKEDV